MSRNQPVNIGVSATCAWAQPRLFAYLDGDLNPTERPTLQTHLETCALCRQELEQNRRAEQALQTARLSAPAVGDLRAGFYTRLAQEDTLRRARNKRLWWSLGALVPAGAAAALVWMTLPMPVSESTQPQIARQPIAPTSSNQSEKLVEIASAPDKSAPSLPVRLRGAEGEGKSSLRPKRARFNQKSVQIVRADSASATSVSLYSDYRKVTAFGKRSEPKPERGAPISSMDKKDMAEAEMHMRAAATIAPTEVAMADRDEISIVVTDEERGFETSARIRGVTEWNGDEENVSIEAESSDSN